MAAPPELSPRGSPLLRGLLLRCPACGDAPLFRGPFRMHDRCSACGVPFTREPGFYLGSIYINYGVTVLVTGGLYAFLALVLGWSQEASLTACLGVAVLLPVAFFRHARSLLLALDGSVNRLQSPHASGGTGPTSAEDLRSLTADDGRAGCAMGVALALVLLFGLGMAVVTVLVSIGGMPPSGE